MPGSLHLIPSVISPNSEAQAIPADVSELVNNFSYFMVEHVRTARRYLIKLGIRTKIDDLTFLVLNKRTTQVTLIEYLKILKSGHDVALLSEAGCPAVADPGASIVRMAHEEGIMVKPYVGPSSIMLALMASGLNGQQFAFHGYLPVNQSARNKKIKSLEKRGHTENETQIFMETPYRNMQLFQALMQNLHNQTHLCIAAGLNAENEYIKTMPVKQWRKASPELHKIPAIFLIQTS